MNADGTPKWRMAPSPHGALLAGGQKLGYQDCGSWTLMKSTPIDRARPPGSTPSSAWPRPPRSRRSHVGLTPIRDSDIRHESFTERAPKLGGLVEFYRSPARVAWTPTGINVPDYPKLAQLWWANVAEAVTGEKTAQEAMDNLAKQQDQILARLERAGDRRRLRAQAQPRRPSAEDWFAKSERGRASPSPSSPTRSRRA